MTGTNEIADPIEIAKAARSDAREALMLSTMAAVMSLVALGLQFLR